MKPHYILDQKDTDYRQYPALNYSHLKLMHQPFLYKQMVIEGKQREASNSMSIGTAVHIHILEPHKKHLIKNLKDYGFEDGRKWQQINKLKEDNPDEIFFTDSDYQKIKDMVTSVKLHPQALKLYASGTWNEVSMFWQDARQGFDCKGRADTLNLEDGYMIDLKTTKDSKGFMKECVDFSYHVQAAFYLRGLKAITGRDFDWYWVASDMNSPHFTYVYKASVETLMIGDIVVDELMNKLAICQEEDMWPIGNEEILNGELPSWYTARILEKVKRGEKYNEFRSTQ